MNPHIFTLEETMAKADLSKRTIQDWIKLKLIVPSGLADDQTALFSEASLEQIAHIRRLEELGYGLEDIHRIVKKIGLPKVKSDKKESREQQRNYLTVGHLAERSGVSPRTIKHWEDKGILEPARRSEGGFRLYSQVYVYLCKLIQDLQLFGYTLEEIKVISGYFRDFLAIQKDPGTVSPSETSAKLDKMLAEIKALFGKMDLFKEGIARWEDLAKKKRKEILSLKDKMSKRAGSGGKKHHA
jgi:DNA-binding transcriptional MerR regulator